MHTLSRAHYEQLVKCGVKVYEYTPGFIHSKVFAVDGQFATVGTINLDYRSLYLHFEDGVYLYGADCVGDIYRDFAATFAQSQEITLKDCAAGPIVRLMRAILRLLAPLM